MTEENINTIQISRIGVVCFVSLADQILKYAQLEFFLLLLSTIRSKMRHYGENVYFICPYLEKINIDHILNKTHR